MTFNLFLIVMKRVGRSFPRTSWQLFLPKSCELFSAVLWSLLNFRNP